MILFGVNVLSVFSTIKIDKSIIKSNRQEIKKAKAIFDKLKLPHIVDDISFHNTSIDLIEKVTPRELDVLRNLAAGKTSKLH